jgi:hypothetical protein
MHIVLKDFSIAGIEKKKGEITAYDGEKKDYLIANGFMKKYEPKVWTKENIIELLETRRDAIERAILALYRLQTEDEQSSQETKHSNGVGFNGADARFMSSLVDWMINKGRRLSFKQAEAAKNKLKKYANQLANIANKKITIV